MMLGMKTVKRNGRTEKKRQRKKEMKKRTAREELSERQV